MKMKRIIPVAGLVPCVINVPSSTDCIANYDTITAQADRICTRLVINLTMGVELVAAAEEALPLLNLT